MPIYQNEDRPFKTREKILNGVDSKTFPMGKQKRGKGLKILTSTQMLLRLLVAFAQLKAGNASENLLAKWTPSNPTFFVPRKKIIKKVSNNIL